MLRTALRYSANLIALVARQRGYLMAARVGSRLVVDEVVKLPRLARFVLRNHLGHLHNTGQAQIHAYSDRLVADLQALGVDLRPYQVNLNAFRVHAAVPQYPHNYAGGPIDQGGWREQKILEYFVSLDLLAVKPSDIVVDIASEWSLFPDVVRKQVGATVYRQDLIYRQGRHGHWIGGSATDLPLPPAFADKLVLHNAFEHFEGHADTEFIAEAWRVLRPGGCLCILPLFMSRQYSIRTDPLVNRRGITWDDGAQVVERPLWHNRFGRFYDAAAFAQRVLQPALNVGFTVVIYHITNSREIHPRMNLHFALLLHKASTAAWNSVPS